MFQLWQSNFLYAKFYLSNSALHSISYDSCAHILIIELIKSRGDFDAFIQNFINRAKLFNARFYCIQWLGYIL